MAERAPNTSSIPRKFFDRAGKNSGGGHRLSDVCRTSGPIAPPCGRLFPREETTNYDRDTRR